MLLIYRSIFKYIFLYLYVQEKCRSEIWTMGLKLSHSLRDTCTCNVGKTASKHTYIVSLHHSLNIHPLKVSAFADCFLKFSFEKKLVLKITGWLQLDVLISML